MTVPYLANPRGVLCAGSVSGGTAAGDPFFEIVAVATDVMLRRMEIATTAAPTAGAAIGLARSLVKGTGSGNAYQSHLLDGNNIRNQYSNTGGDVASAQGFYNATAYGGALNGYYAWSVKPTFQAAGPNANKLAADDACMRRTTFTGSVGDRISWIWDTGLFVPKGTSVVLVNIGSAAGARIDVYTEYAVLY